MTAAPAARPLRTTPPPRLQVLFARDAPEAVIFYRGTSRWFHLIRWETAHDRFHHGAWIKGRIYPGKCDLSPDGRLLLYTIFQGSRLSTGYTDTWTAISRTPWLSAIGLWPQGTTYGGGGRFTGNRSAVLRMSASPPHQRHPAAGLEISFSGLHTSPPEYVFTTGRRDAEWSGKDQQGRLVYTAAGKLFHAATDSNAPVCLADFNGLTPKPEPAPDSAAFL